MKCKGINAPRQKKEKLKALEKTLGKDKWRRPEKGGGRRRGCFVSVAKHQTQTQSEVAKSTGWEKKKTNRRRGRREV